ncbi:MAG: hypothetical protein A2Y24_07510 [Clostridiales bacterium GWE2_32_10]|nr:MAG: hypothetical protein A2Y24_07510 [Clostridiales bacterium GWE2_32_10]
MSDKENFKGFKVESKGVNYNFDYLYIFIDGLALVLKDKKYGFINPYGQEVIPCIYENMEIFESDVARACIDGKCGLINRKGEHVIDFIYDEIAKFSDGCAVVRKGEKKGAINQEGEGIIPCMYENLFDSKYGMIRTKLDGKYGYINSDGNLAIPFIYKDATDFFEEYAIVQDEIGIGGINKKGEKVSEFNKYDFVGVLKNGYRKVNKDDKWGFINVAGKVTVPIIYDFVWPYAKANGYIPVKKDGKYGCVDVNGNIIEPLIHDEEVHVVNESIVETNKVFAKLVDNEIIPCIYEMAGDFNHKIAPVQKDGKVGFIDKQGNEVIPFMYDAFHFSFRD